MLKGNIFFMLTKISYHHIKIFIYYIQYSIFKVTEPDNLMAETMEYAQELAALPLSSLIATKKLLLQGGRTDAVLAAHERESRAFAPFPKGLSGSPANKEALLAFKERRKPDFSKL